MKIAVEGCCHGELDTIYDSVRQAEEKGGYKVDLLLICGDFQAIRNAADLNCLAVPQKYCRLGGFHKYYSGERVAPMLTIVIGGNHEASNYMWELYHGGWLAPNIYFLGFAGAVEVNGLTIAGASGIYKSHDYNLGHFERMPYSAGDMRSIYHVRRYDILKLMMLDENPDIFLSHDWPNTIEQHGDLRALLSKKRFFTDEVNTGTLGSPPLLDLLQTLKPSHWFAAHLHVRFPALYRHDSSSKMAGDWGAVSGSPFAQAEEAPQSANPEEIVIDDDDVMVDMAPSTNPDAIDIDVDEDDKTAAADDTSRMTEETAATEVDLGPSAEPAAEAPLASARTTSFLALSKCTPKGGFLEIVDIPAPESSSPPTFRFSPRWLAITRALHPYLPLSHRPTVPLPQPDSAELRKMVEKEMGWIKERLSKEQSGGENGGDEREGLTTAHSHPLDVLRTQTFHRTAPSPVDPGGRETRMPPWYTNPQTEALCALLDIPNKINPAPPDASGVGASLTGTDLGARSHVRPPPATDRSSSSGSGKSRPLAGREHEHQYRPYQPRHPVPQRPSLQQQQQQHNRPPRPRPAHAKPAQQQSRPRPAPMSAEEERAEIERITAAAAAAAKKKEKQRVEEAGAESAGTG